MNKCIIVVSVLAVLGFVGLIIITIGEDDEANQFSELRDAAKASSERNDFKVIRSQIELYRQQHNGNLPGVVGTATFIQAMTEKTDGFGNSGSDYGPYLQRIPKNAFNGLDTVDVSGLGIIGDDSHGWDFNPKTGYFQADHSAEHER